MYKWTSSTKSQTDPNRIHCSFSALHKRELHAELWAFTQDKRIKIKKIKTKSDQGQNKMSGPFVFIVPPPRPTSDWECAIVQIDNLTNDLVLIFTWKKTGSLEKVSPPKNSWTDGLGSKLHFQTFTVHISNILKGRERKRRERGESARGRTGSWPAHLMDAFTAGQGI